MWQQIGHKTRKFKLRPYPDGNRPHLKYVLNYREEGKRKRAFFETKEQATSFAASNFELSRRPSVRKRRVAPQAARQYLCCPGASKIVRRLIHHEVRTFAVRSAPPLRDESTKLARR